MATAFEPHILSTLLDRIPSNSELHTFHPSCRHTFQIWARWLTENSQRLVSDFLQKTRFSTTPWKKFMSRLQVAAEINKWSPPTNVSKSSWEAPGPKNTDGTSRNSAWTLTGGFHLMVFVPRAERDITIFTALWHLEVWSPGTGQITKNVRVVTLLQHPVPEEVLWAPWSPLLTQLVLICSSCSC